MFNKAVDISPEGQNMIDTFVFLLLIDKRIMCNEVVFEDPFMLKYCCDGCKTQEMCS